MTKRNNNLISDERKTGDLQSLSRMIVPFARNILGKRGFVEIDIITNWDKIAGEELAEFSLPQRIEFKRGEKNNGVLHVMVPSGAFALELQHREKFVLGKINAYFGYNAVSRLKVIQNSCMELSDDAEDNSGAAQKTLVSEEEENYIKLLSGEIENPALQEMLEKLGRSVISHNKGEEK